MDPFKPLPRSFYKPSAREVAPELLGHWLLRRTARGLIGGPIVETEAYLVGDPACHGAPGPTARNQVMFGPPGYAYVYLIYGFHFCVNAVCCPPGTAEAVLIRAVEAEFGLAELQRHRQAIDQRSLTNGPGKLCEAMRIDRGLNGADLCDADSSLVIARNPGVSAFRRARGPVITTARIGITKGADLPLRFCLGQSEYVSRRIASSRPSAGELKPPRITNRN
ncbi:MAG TPA: DNA-3-methyladenine glycosylase [Verrucomicrobiae bacterium]|nr:DNA-3-methyladenine glycosylase [Verrucomicrobiae bacterium]